MGTKTSRHSLQPEMGQMHTDRQKPCAETEDQGKSSMRAGQGLEGESTGAGIQSSGRLL